MIPVVEHIRNQGFTVLVTSGTVTAAQMAVSRGARSDAVARANAALPLAGNTSAEVSLQAKQVLALAGDRRSAVRLADEALSAARTQDPNSASCQFFIMHDKAPHLDGQYSAFGETVMGLDVVDLIVSTPRGQADKPNSPQVIERAIVVTRPSWVPAEPSQTKNGPASVPVPVGGK